VNATKVLQTTDVHCSSPGDCIWNNRTSRYYGHIAQKRIHAQFHPLYITFTKRRQQFYNTKLVAII